MPTTKLPAAVMTALVAICALLASPPPAESAERESARPQRDPVLWYRQPGEKWLEAMPMGNGILGAMVFGGVERERIALNADLASDRPAQTRSYRFDGSDLARGAGELPLPGHHDGGPAQRPGRPRRQHPHAQDDRRQVHRTEPLPVGRRGQSAAQSRARQASKFPRLHQADPEMILQACIFEIVTTAGGPGARAGLGVRRLGPARRRNATSATPTCSIPTGGSRTTGGRATRSPT